MSQPELLKRVVGRLDAIGLPYMLTGSLASSLPGEPRASHDIDIVIDASAGPTGAVSALRSAFPEPRFYLDEAAAQRAVAERTMFNLIDTEEGDEVDFWLLTETPFDRSRFARRYAESFEGIGLAVSQPEDTILVKLRWASLSGESERQFRDALRVYEVQHARLDQAYLQAWADTLGVAALLARLRAEAEPLA